MIAAVPDTRRLNTRRFVAVVVCASMMVGWLPPELASPGFAPFADEQATDRATHEAQNGEGAKEPVVRANWVVRSDLQRETQRWPSPTQTSKSFQAAVALPIARHPAVAGDAARQLCSPCEPSVSLTALHVRMQV
jgi:hypothetical protein